MKYRAVVIFAALLFGTFCSNAVAALHWEGTVVERVAHVGQDVIEFSFPFSNRENHPVTIVHLQPGCGCTSATVEKNTFAPGEKGAVTALLDLKGLTGVQEKDILVFYSDSPKPDTLFLRVTIVPWIEVEPRLLWWSTGEESKIKETVLTLSREAKIKITSVKCDNPVFDVSLRPADETGKYRLSVQPRSTATAGQATITIAMENPGSEPRSYTVFAQVR